MLLKTLKTASPSRKTTSGFTLVEMLVVIVVIGLLAAIAIPIFLSQSDKANDAALKSDLSNAARMLSVAEAGGVTLPSSLPAGQAYAFTAEDGTEYGTITPAATLTVSGSGTSLCVEGTSDSGDVYSADLANGLRNYDCDGNANGVAPLVLSYADTSFTQGSNNETLAAAASGGDGTTKSYSVTGALPDGVTFDSATGTFTGPADSAWGVSQVSSGSYATCVVTGAGGVQCWGVDGSSVVDNVPAILTQNAAAASVSVGKNFACALTTGNAIECWGNNLYNQTVVPTRETGTTWVQVEAGQNHACALTDVGEIQCWGETTDGESLLTVPTRASGDEWISVEAGMWNTCAVTNAGGVQCWGFDIGGPGTPDPNDVPAALATSGAVSADVGNFGACALTTSGGVQCWGVPDDNAVSNPPAGLSGAVDISVGYGGACAITASGGVDCWGWNTAGESKFSFPDDPDAYPSSGVAQVSIGDYGMHTCVVTDNDAVNCWNAYVDDITGDDGVGPNPANPTYHIEPAPLRTGSPDLPTTVDVTVTDDSGSTTESVTLSVG